MNVSTHTLIFFFLFQTPGRVGSQGSDLDSSATPIDVNNESSSEGFICPQCMKSLGSADELFKHYQAVHDAGNDSGLGGEANLALTRDDITLLRQEVQDLQASLKEAKPDGLVTDSSADIKSKYDEEKSLRDAAEQKLTHATEELSKQTAVIQDLKTELLQRPGIEDVAVLKKELVQVQTLMDNMTLERERESEKLKDECKKLQSDYANSEVMKTLREECLHYRSLFYLINGIYI
ncbi:Early endosome antigen 1 [Microtus ochrogaster]|uniref:Early endosome antigen 1 n=1 Tax=Microtus ochrogaster TaxID=79684 RepID=A0A8J6GU72_MICOH|nr:Early endosome antigen 1 [Microtus ochrogaster]